MRAVLALIAIVFHPFLAYANGSLELPSGSMSGIGIVSGWKCPPVGSLTVEFDGGAPLPLATGISRKDTSTACGNSGLNGFIAQYNYNLIGTGHHTAIVRDNGVEFDRNEFDVQTLGGAFLPGLVGRFELPSFPTSGKTTIVEWQEGIQNFVIVGAGGSGSLFDETFEGSNDWFADNGVWQVGSPTSGPNDCAEGDFCAGTNLSGKYPGCWSGHLVSPAIQLPQLGAAEEIRLQFQEWHKLWCCAWDGRQDYGNVQVQIFDSASQSWSAWVELAASSVTGASSLWTQKAVDLTIYNGKRIRIGFAVASGCEDIRHSDSPGDDGWFIDDVIVKRIQ